MVKNFSKFVSPFRPPVYLLDNYIERVSFFMNVNNVLKCSIGALSSPQMNLRLALKKSGAFLFPVEEQGCWPKPAEIKNAKEYSFLAMVRR
jgi:hypothetical protein